MQEHWSIEQYKEYKEKSKRKSKYGAVKTSIDGHTFDSKKEAEFYQELKISGKYGQHSKLHESKEVDKALISFLWAK